MANKSMSMRQVVDMMRNVGYKVSFYVRKDGGIRITKIDGRTFRGSSGNVRAREIVGTQLSERRTKQLSKLTTPKGKGSYDKRRKRKLDEDVIKRIQKIQRQFKKTKSEGQPTRKNYRYVLEHFGKAEADRLLSQADLYSRGIAYDMNIQALIDRLSSDMEKVDSKDQLLIQKLIDRLESMKGILKETTLQKILDETGALYQWEQGRIETQEMVRVINKILDTN